MFIDNEIKILNENEKLLNENIYLKNNIFYDKKYLNKLLKINDKKETLNLKYFNNKDSFKKRSLRYYLFNNDSFNTLNKINYLYDYKFYLNENENIILKINDKKEIKLNENNYILLNDNNIIIYEFNYYNDSYIIKNSFYLKEIETINFIYL